MALYRVQDPQTGVTLTLEGDSPPSEDELSQVFAEYGRKQKTLTTPQVPWAGFRQSDPGMNVSTTEAPLSEPGILEKITDVANLPGDIAGRLLTVQPGKALNPRLGRVARANEVTQPWIKAEPAGVSDPNKSLLGLDPEDVPSGANTTAPAITIPLSSGLKAVGGVAQFMTSPHGIAEVIATLNPTTKPIVMTKWLVDMVAGAIQQIPQAIEAYKQKDWQGVSDALVNAGLMTFGGGVLGRELLGKKSYLDRSEPPAEPPIFPQAPPGTEPPQIPNPQVPIESGPLGAIPEGGTLPQRTRIRITLPKKENQNAINPREIPKSNQPEYQGTALGQDVQQNPDEVRQNAGEQTSGSDSVNGSPGGQAPNEAPGVLTLPPVDQIAAMGPSEFMKFRDGLGENNLPAQKQIAGSISPVNLRQLAQQSADEYTQKKNSVAQLKGRAVDAAIQDLQGIAGKMQFFNEALREAGEPPVLPSTVTPEEQVGNVKKGGRKAVMGSGVTEKENRLIVRQEKLENDWSVATKSGAHSVNADELNQGAKIWVRGEPLTVESVGDDGTVSLKSEKGGRWGDRKLESGQQITVDQYESSKESGFEPRQTIEGKEPSTLQSVPEPLPPKLAESDVELGKGSSTVVAPIQKYHLEGQGPQLYTLIERLAQTEAEKTSGEQPVRVKNEKTGREETILEAQLQPVKERTSEEREASKGLSKRELDDQLRKWGMEPTEFPNMASKREALKRARAKGEERAASLPPQDREAAFKNNPAAILLGKPIELATPDDIRAAITDPKLNITNTHRKALDWLAKSGMMETLPGLKLEIVDYIRGGAVGEYIGDKGVARFLRWTDADVPIHEFIHHVWRYLGEDDRAFVGQLRQAELARSAPQMGDTFKIGISSDEFMRRGFNRDLYHMSNDSEFFAWMMTEKALKDMNKPEALTFSKKVQSIIEKIWNGLRDMLRFSQNQDALWREILSGKYEYKFEDARRYADSQNLRALALVRSARDAAGQMINFDEMSDTQKREMGTDVELQNRFVEPLAQRFQGARAGVLSKLSKVFGDRLAAIAESRARGSRFDVNTYEELMAEPTMDPETKQIIVGDMEKNVRSFRDTGENLLKQSDSKIQDYQKKIVSLTEDLDVQKARRNLLSNAARRIVSDYQNRYLNRIRQGGQAGEAGASAEVMRNLQQLKQSPDIIGRIIDQIASTVPDNVLSRPGITAPELLQALMQANGGNLETLSAAMGESQRGVGREMLQTAIGIMQTSDELADNVLAIRPTINPEDVRALQSLAVELRDAARKGARSDMRQLIKEVGGTAETLSVTRQAIGRLQPRIRRAARQLDEWLTAQDILEQSLADPALKELERKLYAHFDVRSVVVTQGGDHEFTMRNPLTNEEVKIMPGLDKLNVESNYARLQKLFDDAAAYIANPNDRNYNPRLAAAWKYMIENTQQFWLNPSLNVFMPHMTPYQFDLPGFLTDPFKTLRTNAGLEANEAQVKLNAMAKTKKLLGEWERKTGMSVDISNKKAAVAAKMTLENWYDHVFSEVAFRQQYLGQVPLRIGDLLLNGHIVTAEDVAAVKTNFAYLRHVRDIAENSSGFTAAALNPARVVEGGIGRRAEPTGPSTLPARRAPRAVAWSAEWRRMQSFPERIAWLTDSERFRDIVIGHLDTYATPGYTVNSRWRDLYRGIVSDFKRSDGVENITDIAQILYDSQNFEDLGPNAQTREQIQAGLLTEINQGFENFEKEGQGQHEKPETIVQALSAENSFTKPRADRVSSPHTFYDYGVRDYGSRLRMANDAYAWYSLDFVQSLERLQSALNRRITQISDGLTRKELKVAQKQIRQAQLRGDEMFDLAELKLNAKRIETLLDQQTRVLQSSRAGRSAMESIFYRTQAAVGSYILMTPGARSAHTFGMMGVSGVFNALVENRVVRPSAKAWARLFGAVLRDVAKIPVSGMSNEQLRSWNGIMEPYAEMVLARREQMERLKELTIVPDVDVKGVAESNLLDWRNVFRRNTPEALSEKIVKGIAGLSDLHNAFWLAWSPQRYNDWILNSSIREMRQDVMRRLQVNAIKHLRNRSEVLGAGYSDFSRPENVLTAQEITGSKGAGAEREAFEKRRLFKVLGLDLDHIMLRYFRAVDEARANGENTGSIKFLTEAEENSLDFEFAEGLGLSTPGTRNLAAQGSLLRRATGYIHGLPLSTMGKFMSLFNRLSNQTGPKYASAVAPMVLMAGAYTTLMGLARIQSTTSLNRLFYNQSSAIPTIGQAKTTDDWARLLLRAQAGWWPIIGDVLMGTLLRTPDRFGHLDSMFVMWNFITDFINTSGDIWHTKDVAGPLTKFAERWLPPTKIITRRLQSQTGVRDHYNAVADIQSALPSSMETAAAKFRGGLRPTETTPLTYRALNAMYNGDWAAFDQVAQEYAQKKADQGVKDGLSAFKHSITAHNPWIERLGKLPTDDERAQILARMDDTQKAEILKAEQTFQEFGQRYGTRVAFTTQQSEAQKGAAGGGGEPTAGIGIVKGSLSGIPGGLRGIMPSGTSSPVGLRRISVGGTVRPGAALRDRALSGLPSGRRLRTGRAVGRKAILVHGKLRGYQSRSGRRRLGMGRQRKAIMV